MSEAISVRPSSLPIWASTRNFLARRNNPFCNVTKPFPVEERCVACTFNGVRTWESGCAPCSDIWSILRWICALRRPHSDALSAMTCPRGRTQTLPSGFSFLPVLRTARCCRRTLSSNTSARLRGTKMPKQESHRCHRIWIGRCATQFLEHGTRRRFAQSLCLAQKIDRHRRSPSGKETLDPAWSRVSTFPHHPSVGLA